MAYDKGDLEEAVRLCEQGLKNGGTNLALLNRLGQAQLDLGQTDEAVKALEQTLQSPDRSAENYYLLGQAYLQAGNYSKAVERFQNAIELRPDHTQAFFGLFNATMRQGQMEEAQKYRDQFLKLEAMDRQALTERSAQEDTLTGLPLVRQTAAKTLFGAAQIYRLHEKNIKAEELFFKAAAIDPNNALSRSALEALMVSRKAVPEAVQTFEKLASIQPENSLNHLYLGRLHEQLQHFEAAERAYRKVRDLTPEWPEGYRALIELYFRNNRQLVESQALARRLLDLEPNSGPNFYLLAFACIRNNDRQGAVAAMENAVALSPGNKRFEEFLQKLKEAP